MPTIKPTLVDDVDAVSSPRDVFCCLFELVVGPESSSCSVNWWRSDGIVFLVSPEASVVVTVVGLELGEVAVRSVVLGDVVKCVSQEDFLY